MPHKSPMNIEIIRQKYSEMETDSLIKLLDEITSLTYEAMVVLQNEFLKRDETESALIITEFLISSRFLIPEENIINYLLVMRKRGLSENEIDRELKSSFGIDQEYINYSKSTVKSRGRENLMVGIVLTLIPLVVIILTIIKGGYAGFGAVIILPFGIWRTIAGTKLLTY